MQSDDQLLALWRDGDLRAGGELFDRHFDSVYGFFQRRVSGDVSDLVQRTFLGCVESRDRFEGRCSVRTFTFAIARKILLKHFSERSKDADFDFFSTSIQDLSPTPSSLLRRKDDVTLLHEALRRIPVDFQIAVELTYWEGMAGPEVAEVLQIPEGTVRSRIRRGLSHLRKELEGLAEASSDPNRGTKPWQAEDFGPFVLRARPSTRTADSQEG